MTSPTFHKHTSVNKPVFKEYNGQNAFVSVFSRKSWVSRLLGFQKCGLKCLNNLQITQLQIGELPHFKEFCPLKMDPKKKVHNLVTLTQPVSQILVEIPYLCRIWLRGWRTPSRSTSLKSPSWKRAWSRKKPRTNWQRSSGEEETEDITYAVWSFKLLHRFGDFGDILCVDTETKAACTPKYFAFAASLIHEC